MIVLNNWDDWAMKFGRIIFLYLTFMVPTLKLQKYYYFSWDYKVLPYKYDQNPYMHYRPKTNSCQSIRTIISI